MRRWRASIGLRLATGLLLLGAVAIGGGAMTFLALQQQQARNAEILRLAEGEALLERVRVGVFAVVMESRGLYLARDRRQAEGFAAGLMRHLRAIERDWAELRPRLPPSEAETARRLEAALAGFVQLRTELARIGVEQGREAADRLGNNDANRANRTAFSDALEALSTSLAATVDRLGAEAAAEARRAALGLLGLAVLAVALVTGGMLWFARRDIARPLARLAAALHEMAEGRLDGTKLPPAGPDEVGRIAAAAAGFRDRLAENARLAAQAAEERDRAEAARHAAAQQAADRLEASLGAVVRRLAGSASGLRGAAERLEGAVGRTAGQAVSAASGAAEASGNVQAVAAAAEELTAAIAEITRRRPLRPGG